MHPLMATSMRQSSWRQWVPAQLVPPFRSPWCNWGPITSNMLQAPSPPTHPPPLPALPGTLPAGGGGQAALACMHEHFGMRRHIASDMKINTAIGWCAFPPLLQASPPYRLCSAWAPRPRPRWQTQPPPPAHRWTGLPPPCRGPPPAVLAEAAALPAVTWRSTPTTSASTATREGVCACGGPGRGAHGAQHRAVESCHHHLAPDPSNHRHTHPRPRPCPRLPSPLAGRTLSASSRPWRTSWPTRCPPCSPTTATSTPTSSCSSTSRTTPAASCCSCRCSRTAAGSRCVGPRPRRGTAVLVALSADGHGCLRHGCRLLACEA